MKREKRRANPTEISLSLVLVTFCWIAFRFQQTVFGSFLSIFRVFFFHFYAFFRSKRNRTRKKKQKLFRNLQFALTIFRLWSWSQSFRVCVLCKTVCWLIAVAGARWWNFEKKTKHSSSVVASFCWSGEWLCAWKGRIAASCVPCIERKPISHLSASVDWVLSQNGQFLLTWCCCPSPAMCASPNNGCLRYRRNIPAKMVVSE